MKRYKSPGIDQILAELIQAEGETLWCETQKFINPIWNKEELPDQWKEAVIVGYHCYQLHTTFCPVSSQG
jgi:hypothetical protein